MCLLLCLRLRCNKWKRNTAHYLTPKQFGRFGWSCLCLCGRICVSRKLRCICQHEKSLLPHWLLAVVICLVLVYLLFTDCYGSPKANCSPGHFSCSHLQRKSPGEEVAPTTELLKQFCVLKILSARRSQNDRDIHRPSWSCCGFCSSFSWFIGQRNPSE